MTPGTLVLLHAPGATAASWGDLPEMLRSYGLDVVAPDVPDDAGPRYIARVSLTITATDPVPPLVLVAHGAAAPCCPASAWPSAPPTAPWAATSSSTPISPARPGTTTTPRRKTSPRPQIGPRRPAATSAPIRTAPPPPSTIRPSERPAYAAGPRRNTNPPPPPPNP
ncbi:hypothetical protein ACFQY7_41705 [Actinomadura luteofluorescens]|uniref:hypothetical protein n=1 Tax=Actinomadura luteofluorescens TaxID=46163 RepID=UPI00363708CC